VDESVSVCNFLMTLSSLCSHLIRRRRSAITLHLSLTGQLFTSNYTGDIEWALLQYGVRARYFLSFVDGICPSSASIVTLISFAAHSLRYRSPLHSRKPLGVELVSCHFGSIWITHGP
jgi:hypothetical protein